MASVRAGGVHRTTGSRALVATAASALLVHALALTGCGRVADHDATCLPASDLDVTFDRRVEAPVVMLALDVPWASRRPFGTLWPAVGSRPDDARRLMLTLESEEPAAMLLVPNAVCSYDALDCLTWTRADLDRAQPGERLSGGALLLARLGPSPATYAAPRGAPTGRLLIVRLSPPRQREPVMGLRGRVQLRWAQGSRACPQSASPSLIAVTTRPWPPVCGNGVLEQGEECDAGLVDGTAGCSAACAVVAASCADDAAPGEWVRWICDESREPTRCRPSPCPHPQAAEACGRRHDVTLAVIVEGRATPDVQAARLRVPSLLLECACADPTASGCEGCSFQVTPCSGAEVHVDLEPGARLLGWESDHGSCRDAASPCRLPDDGPLTATALVRAADDGVRGVHHHAQFQQVVAARDGHPGWYLSTSDGERSSGAILRVDHDLRPRWTWRAPRDVSVSALAALPGGGVAATVLVHGDARLGQHHFTGRGGGLISLGPDGRLRWVQPLFEGMQRLPHRLAVEPGGLGRIAVAMRDVVERTRRPDGSVLETWAATIGIFGPDGMLERRLRRPYEYVSGMAWAPGDRLVVLGARASRGEQPDPWVLEGTPRRFTPGDNADVLAVTEAIDPESGQAWWSREHGRANANWEALPALGADGALAFADYFFRDRPLDPRRTVWPQRFVVLDVADGSLRATEVDEAPRRCGGITFVGVDPRDGQWIVARPRECNGVGRWPSAVLVERLTPGGARVSTTRVGHPLPGHRGDELRRHTVGRMHPQAMAVDSTGHTVLVGFVAHEDLAGTNLEGDFVHFALVVDP